MQFFYCGSRSFKVQPTATSLHADKRGKRTDNNMVTFNVNWYKSWGSATRLVGPWWHRKYSEGDIDWHVSPWTLKNPSRMEENSFPMGWSAQDVESGASLVGATVWWSTRWSQPTVVSASESPWRQHTPLTKSWCCRSLYLQKRNECFLNWGCRY